MTLDRILSPMLRPPRPRRSPRRPRRLPPPRRPWSPPASYAALDTMEALRYWESLSDPSPLDLLAGD